jgi:hypothetical protein
VCDRNCLPTLGQWLGDTEYNSKKNLQKYDLDSEHLDSQQHGIRYTLSEYQYIAGRQSVCDMTGITLLHVDQAMEISFVDDAGPYR